MNRKFFIPFFSVALMAVISISFTVLDEKWINASKEEIKQDLLKVKTWYDKHEVYELHLSYRSFENHTTIKPADESAGYFRRNKMNYHSYMLGIETVQNDKIRVVVDTSNKTILLSEPTKMQAPYDDSLFSRMMDKCETFKKVGTTNEKMLKIKFPKNFYLEAYEMNIEKSEFLKKITLFYAQEISASAEKNSRKSKPRIEISFSSQKINPVFSPQEFSVKRFVEFDGKKYVAPKNFSNYKIYDTRYKN